MRMASRKVRLPDGTEDVRCVDMTLRVGSVVEMADGQTAVLIDERAPGGKPKRAAGGIGFPAIGGRCYLNGGYRSAAWGVNPDPQSIAEAKEVTPEWDFDRETGDAIIPSERALKSGVAKNRAQQQAQMAAEAAE